MLFSISMLVGGVLSPMLEVEVRITRLDATLLGTPIQFQDQSLYYRSKTVLEVFQTLIQMGRPEMTLVAVLLILFSVVFPALKMMALGACLFRPALLRTSRLVKLLAFQLSKWSMADVMALAIFMSFVAFNGVIGSGLEGLRGMPKVQQVLIPTDASRILPGYYPFIGFCVSSIILSKKLEHGIASNSTSESSYLALRASNEPPLFCSLFPVPRSPLPASPHLCYSRERMEFSNIHLDLRPPVAQVTLDRPKVLNALNAATLAELAAAF